jgi:alpha-galactosidase
MPPRVQHTLPPSPPTSGQTSRDPVTHVIQADPDRFPSGMRALGQYIHERGLRFGIYSSAGYKTCQGRPGSLGYEALDAATYAEWGVDFLKLDNCFNDGASKDRNIARYSAMRDALNATGRPIFYSMCNWGQAGSWEW